VTIRIKGANCMGRRKTVFTLVSLAEHEVSTCGDVKEGKHKPHREQEVTETFNLQNV
jgi:hypothetical protein